LEIIEEIVNNSIFSILKLPILNSLNNYIKGGLVEKGIIQLMKTNNSPFGKFDTIYEIDCYFNSKDKRIKKVKKAKNFKRLKEKYAKKKYNGESSLIIPFNNNSKEWDIGFILENKHKKRDLCLGQISVNKSIKKIKEMFTDFPNKIKFIKAKIREIYDIEINYLNVLFILSNQWQNPITLEFLKKYKIPFILFDCQNDGLTFSNKNLDPLDIFTLNIEHHYLSNQSNYENALKDEMKDKINEQFDDEYSQILDDESEEEEDEFNDSKNGEIKDILLNNFPDDEIQ
jgi:hypothetical protein